MIILLTKLQHLSKLQWAKLPDGHEKPVLQCWTVKLALKFLSNAINTGVGSIIVFDTGVQPARVMNPNWAWGTLEPHFTFLRISHITILNMANVARCMALTGLTMISLFYCLFHLSHFLCFLCYCILILCIFLSFSATGWFWFYWGLGFSFLCFAELVPSTLFFWYKWLMLRAG